MIRIEKTTPRFKLVMVIERMGRDLNVSLHGGDESHIGAVALAVPYQGQGREGKADASVSLRTVTGHKEAELARKISYTLATAFNCTTATACGIHIDNATGKEIADILEIADRLLEEALQELS